MQCVKCGFIDAYSPQTKCCNATVCYNCANKWSYDDRSGHCCPKFGQCAGWKAPADSYDVLMKREKEIGNSIAFIWCI